jgi:hypothetical protein
MTVVLINSPKPERMKIWEWLRQVADQLEKGSSTDEDFAVLVTCRYEGSKFRLRAEKHNVDHLEAIGALTTAMFDLNVIDD